MSKFSGKCDLYDHLKNEKTYKKYPDNEYSPLVSDDLECFNIFKQKTKGIIYKYVRCILSKNNIDQEIEKINDKDILYKTKENNRTVYYYYNKRYTDLKKLNDKGYYIKKEIKFNTLLDLVPYFPYTIAMSMCDKDKEYILLSEKSYVDEKEEDYLVLGFDISNLNYYREQLQSYYITCVNNYYNIRNREVIKKISLKNVNLKKVELNDNIDSNFDVRIIDPLPCMSSPDIIDADLGIISLEGKLINNSIKSVTLSYITQDKDQKLILD